MCSTKTALLRKGVYDYKHQTRIYFCSLTSTRVMCIQLIRACYRAFLIQTTVLGIPCSKVLYKVDITKGNHWLEPLPKVQRYGCKTAISLFFLLENGDFHPIKLCRKMCSANNNNNKLMWRVRLTESRSAEFSNSFWSITLSKTKLLRNNSTTKLFRLIYVRLS